MTNRMAANIATARRNAVPQVKLPRPPDEYYRWAKEMGRLNTYLLTGQRDGIPLSPEARENIELDRAECRRHIARLLNRSSHEGTQDG